MEYDQITWADIQAMEDGTYTETREDEAARQAALYRAMELEDEYGGPAGFDNPDDY